MACEPVCISDFEEHARRCLPKTTFEYFASGAGEQNTLEENRNAFKRIRLRPRMLRGITDQVDMSTTILGHTISMPICIAPTALQKLAHPDGEVATVKAAACMNTGMILSVVSTSTLEEVATAAPDALKWFLIYILRDRDLLKSLIRRAEASGYDVITLVTDSPMLGHRYIEAKHGPAHLIPPHIDIVHLGKEKSADELFEHFINWETVDWLKSLTKLPIVLKGILTPEDAKLAVEHGVDGIIVSNHGGRQLDGVPATIDVLPEIVDAVQGKLEVYMDGGVRLGTDVFKALALGARAVFIGRPVIWGLAYKGEEGVRKVLELLREELRLAMILSGCGSLADISSSCVVPCSKLSRL